MKMLKYVSLFAVVCILMACIAGTAFAAGSKSDPVEITPVDGVTITEKQENDPILTMPIAARLAGEKVENGKVVYQWNASAETLPVTLTFNTELGANQRGYVYHWTGSEWELMGKVNAGIQFSSLSPVGVAIFESSGSGSGSGGSGGSPKTGENNPLTSLAFAAIAMGGALVFFSTKKKN